MKSKFADVFNHDENAAGYDTDVLNESHPIRASYEAVLNWVSEKSATTGDSIVLDLGCGTGNLSLRLKHFKRLVCVDISDNMLDIARSKLAGLDNVEFVKADLLEYFEDAPVFEAIASTYTIHHLTEAEKPILFKQIYCSLQPGGMAVFGDLMFANTAAQEQLIQKYQAEGRFDVARDIQDEFFWVVDEASDSLTKLDFGIEIKRFSDLSWGIAAQKGGTK
jgi:ubiquinone/menaquinone biosynthesis C-methylase UbiE